MNQELQQKVLGVVNEVLMLDKGEDLLDASFKDELSLTSLERMTLFIALEDEFESSIPQEEVEHIDSVRGVIEFIDRKGLS